MSPVVLDSSAVLAWLRNESGGNTVAPLLSTSVVSSVNWCEVAQKLVQHGADAPKTAGRLQALGVAVEPFTPDDALSAGALWTSTHQHGLSLGDRACLALGARLGLPVVTADQAWGKLQVSVPVQLIR